MKTTESEQIKILIVEDHLVVRMGLRMALEREFQIIGEAEDGLQAVSMANELKPNVILMDIGLPRMDGVKATNIIKQQSSTTRVIMLTSHHADTDILAALAAGADGYCLKETHGSQLILAIHAVMKGSAWLDPSIASRIISWTNGLPVLRGENGTKTANVFALSESQLAVLRLIVEGLSDQKIAARLGIDLATIGDELRRIIDNLAERVRN